MNVKPILLQFKLEDRANFVEKLFKTDKKENKKGKQKQMRNNKEMS